jgi:hypothetical protein
MLSFLANLGYERGDFILFPERIADSRHEEANLHENQQSFASKGSM